MGLYIIYIIEHEYDLAAGVNLTYLRRSTTLNMMLDVV